MNWRRKAKLDVRLAAVERELFKLKIAQEIAPEIENLRDFSRRKREVRHSVIVLLTWRGSLRPLWYWRRWDRKIIRREEWLAQHLLSKFKQPEEPA